MTGPALPEVHLLRGPGHPAGHRGDKSPQTRRHRAQICTLRPRRRLAHCRGHRRQRVAREWDNGPRNRSSAGSLGCGETTPPSRSRAVSPRVAESRSSRTRWRTPTCRNCLTAATHGRSPQPSLRGRKEQSRPIGAGPPAEAVPPHKAAPTPRSATHRGASSAPQAAPGPLPPTPRGPHEPLKARARPCRLTGSCSCCWGPHP